MEYTTTQIIGAILMVLVVVGLFVTWRRYQATNSERRMLAMLGHIGIDPAIVSSGDFEGIVSEVRQRCRHCQSEDVCERWLKGQEAGGNDFCPNLTVFEILRKYTSSKD